MNHRLSAFVAVSCLAHASVVWWAQRAGVPALNIGGEARVLHVTLAAASAAPAVVDQLAALESPPVAVTPRATARQAPPSAAKKPAQPVAAAPFPTRPAAIVRPRTRQRITDTTTDQPGQEANTADHHAQPQPAAPGISERVSAALQSQLAAAFDYPWLARKRGWQGLVTLSLHIDQDGALSQWKILRTSGYSLLDHSALQAAQRIGRLPQAGHLLNGRSLNLSIPVSYRLLDG
jgi:periplasmic protein TonB